MSNMHLVTGYGGTAHVTAADHGSFWAAVVGDGDYVFDIGQKFAATIVSNNLIRIADGDLLMQGRHARINNGETIELPIENGTAGKLRRDLVVARYTKSDETGVEETNLVVILGTAADTSPADPEYITGNILNGDLQRDFPLFRINLNGITVSSVDPLFTTIPGMLANNKLLSEALQTDIKSLDARIKTSETLVNSAAKIKIGTYIGTGTAGQGVPTSIVCGFKPKHVLIRKAGITSFEYFGEMGLINYISSFTETLICDSSSSGSSEVTGGSSSSDPDTHTFVIANNIAVTLTDIGITWHTTMANEVTDTQIGAFTKIWTATVPTSIKAAGQYNTSGETYYYMILG